MTNFYKTGDIGGGPPQQPFRLEDINFPWLTRIVKLILLGLIVLGIFMGLNWARGFYTDWLWFSSLGHEQVLFVRVTTQIWLYLLAVLVFVVLAAPNLYLAYRNTADYQWQQGRDLSRQDYQGVRRLMLWVGILAIVLGATFLAIYFSARWETFLRFFNCAPFNETDPVFGRDLSFYVFSLPVLSFLRTWL
ncbi:MAG: UPF0182 family protein, partial [Desulfosalsimonas sp.]